MWTSHKKEIVWAIGLFSLVFFGANIVWNYGEELLNKIDKKPISQMASVIKVVPINTRVEMKNPEMIKLAFVGDIMLDRGVKWSVNKNFGGDYNKLFEKVTDKLNSYDLLFGNLEGPASDKGTDGGSLYSFRMDPKVLPVLKDAGFDIFSLANNHIMNYGLEAFEDTKIRLKENNIFIANEDNILDIKGVKIVILSFNQFSGLNFEKMKEEIYKARLISDLVIVSFHFGLEYQKISNLYQVEVSKSAIDAGADLIIGHHPHVVQNLEQYKNAYIIYSLGNFIFDQYFSEETMSGGLLEVEVNSNTKLIEKVGLKKVSLNKNFQIESIR